MEGSDLAAPAGAPAGAADVAMAEPSLHAEAGAAVSLPPPAAPVLDFARMVASAQRRVSSGGLEGRTLSSLFAHMEAAEAMRLRERDLATHAHDHGERDGDSAAAASAAPLLDPFARFHLLRLVAAHHDIDIFLKQPTTNIPLPADMTNAEGGGAAAGGAGAASADPSHHLPLLSVLEWGALPPELQLAHVRTSALALRAQADTSPLGPLWSAAAAAGEAASAASAGASGAATEQGMLDEAMSGRPCTWISTHQGMLHQSSLTRLPLSAALLRALSPVEVHDLSASLVLVASMRARCAFLGLAQADLESLRPYNVHDRAEKEARRALTQAGRAPKRAAEPEAPFLLFNLLETVGRFSVQTILPHTFSPLPDVASMDGLSLRRGLGGLVPAANAGWAPSNHAGILQHHLGRVMRLSSGNAYRFLLLLEGRGMVAPIKQMDDNSSSGTTGGGGWRWFLAHLAPSAHAAQRASACASMSIDTPFASAGSITGDLPLLSFQANVASIHSYYRRSCNIKTFRRRLKTEKDREAERIIVARSMLEGGTGAAGAAAAAAAGAGDAMLDDEEEEGEKKPQLGLGAIPASSSAVSMPLVQLRPRLSEQVRGPGPSFELHASITSQMYRAIESRGVVGMSTPELRAHFNYCFPIKLILTHVQTLLKQYGVKSMADQTGRSLVYRFFTADAYQQFVAQHTNLDVQSLSQHWGAAAAAPAAAAAAATPATSQKVEAAQPASMPSAEPARPIVPIAGSTLTTVAAAAAAATSSAVAESGPAAASSTVEEVGETAGSAASGASAPTASTDSLALASGSAPSPFALPLSSLEAATVNPRTYSGYKYEGGVGVTLIEPPLPHAANVTQARMAGMQAARTTLKTVTRERLALEYLHQQASHMARHTDVMMYIKAREYTVAAADALAKGLPPPPRITFERDTKTATRLWGGMAAHKQLQQLNVAVPKAVGGHKAVLVLALPDVDLSLDSVRHEALRVARHDVETQAEKVVQQALEEGRVPEMTLAGTPRIKPRSKRTAGSASRGVHRRRNKQYDYARSGSDESTDRSSDDSASASDDEDQLQEGESALDTDEGRAPGSGRKGARRKSRSDERKSGEGDVDKRVGKDEDETDPDYFYPLSHGWIRPRMLRLRFVLDRLWNVYSQVERDVEPVPGATYWTDTHQSKQEGEVVATEVEEEKKGQEQGDAPATVSASAAVPASDLHLAPVSLASVSAAAALASSTSGDASAAPTTSGAPATTSASDAAGLGPLPPARCVNYSSFFSHMSLSDWLSIVGAVETDMGTDNEACSLLSPAHLDLSVSHPDVKPWAVRLTEQQRWRKAIKVRQMFKFAEDLGLVCQARKHERPVQPGVDAFHLALASDSGVLHAPGEPLAPEDDLIGANYGLYLLQPRVRCMGRVWDLTSEAGRDAYWLALRDAALRIYRVRRAHRWAGDALTPKQLEDLLMRDRPAVHISTPPPVQAAQPEGATADVAMADTEADPTATAADAGADPAFSPAQPAAASSATTALSAASPRSSLAPEQLLVQQFPIQKHAYLYNVKHWSLGPPLPQHVVDAINNLSVARVPPPATFIDEIARGFECRRAMVAVQLARKRYPFVEQQVQMLQLFDSGSRDLFTHDRFNRQLIPKRGKKGKAGAAAGAAAAGSASAEEDAAGSASASGRKRKRAATKVESAADMARTMEEDAYSSGVARALRPEELTKERLDQVLGRAVERSHGYGGDLYSSANLTLPTYRPNKSGMFSLIRAPRHSMQRATAAAAAAASAPSSSAAAAPAAAAAADQSPQQQQRRPVATVMYDDDLGLGDGAGIDMDEQHAAASATARSDAARSDEEGDEEEEGDSSAAAPLGGTSRVAPGRSRPFRPRNRWSANEDDVLVLLYNEWLVAHYEPWLKLQQQPITRDELDRAARRSLASVIPAPPAGAAPDENVPQGLWAGAQVNAVMAAHSAQRAPLINVNNFISSGMGSRNPDAVRRRIEVLRLKGRLPSLAALSGSAVPAVHRSLGFQALSTHVFPHPLLSSLLSLVKMVLSQSQESYNARQAAALIHHFPDHSVDVVLKSLKTDRWITQTKSNQNQLGRSYKFASGWGEHMKPQGVAADVFAAARESLDTWMALHAPSQEAAALANSPSRFTFDVHSRGGDLAAIMSLVSEGRARLIPRASDASSPAVADQPDRLEVGVDVESLLQPIAGADEEREDNLLPLVSTLPAAGRAPLSDSFLRSHLSLPFSSHHKVDIPADETTMLAEEFLLPAPTPHSPTSAALLRRMREGDSGSPSGSAASSPSRSGRPSVSVLAEDDDVDMTDDAAASSSAAAVPDPLLMSVPSVGHSGAAQSETGTAESWLDIPEVMDAQRILTTLLDNMGPDGVEWAQLRSMYLDVVAQANPAQAPPSIPLVVSVPLHAGCSMLEKALARALSLLEVLRVSAHESAWRYVHARYCQLWCVPTFHQQPQEEVKADFTDTALTAHPWRSLDGSINQPLFQSFQQAILSLLLVQPGMSVAAMQRHLPVVSPAELEQLLSFLALEDKITERVQRDHAAALFSQPFGLEQRDQRRRNKKRKKTQKQAEAGQPAPSQRYLFPTTQAFAL